MNGTRDSVKEIIKRMNDSTLDPNTEVVVSPPALYLLSVREHTKKEVEVCAQNAYHEPVGAFTGEISPQQLLDADITWVILGHSERRTVFEESDELVGIKVAAASKAKLGVILCCGETLEERDAGKTIEVVRRHLGTVAEKFPDWKNTDFAKIVIAYEPVWAIGTGKVATTEQAQEVHKDIRNWVRETIGDKAADETRIIYGGSVNSKNAPELSKQPDIDGFLVGGASLKPEFVDIVNVNRKAS